MRYDIVDTGCERKVGIVWNASDLKKLPTLYSMSEEIAGKAEAMDMLNF